MTVLEIDLGQVFTFNDNNDGVSHTQIVKVVGLINDNNVNKKQSKTIHILNKPNNKVFVNKIGNFESYLLTLTFTKM